jgi:hypothetical protein
MAVQQSPEALVKGIYNNKQSFLERISLCDELRLLDFPQKQAILDKWIVVFATNRLAVMLSFHHLHNPTLVGMQQKRYTSVLARVLGAVPSAVCWSSTAEAAVSGMQPSPRGFACLTLAWQAFQQLFLHGNQLTAPFSAVTKAASLFERLLQHDYPIDYVLQLFTLAGTCYEQQRASHPAVLTSLLPLYAAIIAHIAQSLSNASTSKKIVSTTAKQLVLLMDAREKVSTCSDDVDAIVTLSLLHAEHLPLYSLSFQHTSIYRVAVDDNHEDKKALPKAAFTKAVFEALETTHAIDPTLTERFMPVFFDLFCQACQQSDGTYTPMRRQWLLDLFVELDTLLTGWHMLPEVTSASDPPNKRAKRQSTSVSTVERGLHVLQSLLHVVDARHVFDEGQDVLDGSHATAYFSQLVGRLLPLATMAVTAEVVATLINLHFGFVEPHLNGLFDAVLAQPEQQHVVLLDALFNIYVRLRQLDLILPAIVAAGDNHPLAHMALLETRLALAVPSLPAGQALELAYQLLSAETVSEPALRLVLCLAEHGLVSRTVVSAMDSLITALAAVNASGSLQSAVVACRSLLETLKTRLLTHTSMDTAVDERTEQAQASDPLAASLDVLNHWHAHEGKVLGAALKHVLTPTNAGTAAVQAFFQSDLFLDALPLHVPTVELILRHCKSPLKGMLPKPLVKALFKCEASELAATEFEVAFGVCVCDGCTLIGLYRSTGQCRLQPGRLKLRMR